MVNFSINYIFIIMYSVAGILDTGISFARRCGCSAAMKRAWLSFAFTIHGTVYRSPLNSAACIILCLCEAAQLTRTVSAHPTMLCIPLVPTDDRQTRLLYPTLHMRGAVGMQWYQGVKIN